MRQKEKSSITPPAGAPGVDQKVEHRADFEHDLDLSYEDFVKVHGLGALNGAKASCHALDIGLTSFYEHVAEGAIILVPNGRRRHVTSKNLYQIYRKLIATARTDRAASNRVAAAPEAVSG